MTVTGHPSGPSVHKRILIVEDEASIRDMVAFALRKAGMDAAHAADARAAQMAISERVPDLILLDWMLPGTSGLELARRLRREELSREIPIIMLTARGEEMDRVNGLEAGVDDYVVKPFSTRELIARIKAVLRRSQGDDGSGMVELGKLRIDGPAHRVFAGDEAVPEREAVLGRWGLISGRTSAGGLAKAEKLSTFNARSETAARSFTFGNAWQRAQHCIIPVEAVYEPDWRSGRAVATRFSHVDGVPLGIAGLWDKFRDAAGQWHETYAMLTINADQHPLFRDYHRAGEEKRMVVILPAGAYGDWLAAGADDTRDFLHPFSAEQLLAQTAIPAAGPGSLF